MKSWGVYISGKITGDPDYKQKFKRAEEALQRMGAAPINPARLSEGLTKNFYLPVCLQMLLTADVVYLLDDWKESEGAKIEEAVARYQGIPVIYPTLEDDPWFKEERAKMQTENLENGWTGLKYYGDINSAAVIRIDSGEEEGGGSE